jgi:regulator of replication initiation timing
VKHPSARALERNVARGLLWLVRSTRRMRVAADQGRVDSVEAAEDAMRKIQRLKKALGRSRVLLSDEEPASPALLKRAAELPVELKQWEEQLEEIRGDLANLLAERDRWHIAHDKLRERLDQHTLEPRSDADRKVQSSRQPVRARSAEDSQDFTAIDKELERLNASMLRAFSQE